jgi:formamidopyrimidine-DNA glycosylase
MPELPEVETVCRKINEAFKGQIVREVHAEIGDRFLFAFEPLAKVKTALTGARILGTGRRGKYFWLELDRKPCLLLHLGMTGNVEIRAPKDKSHVKSWGGVRLWSQGDNKEPGRLFFCRLLLVTENGAELALTDPRRFARLWLAEEPLLHPRLRKLGFDPLQSFPKWAELRALLGRRKAPIKAVLLDQKLFAGVGNWIADEILYHAGIAPRRAAASLTPAELKRLRAKTLLVIRKAVAVESDYERFPRSWLFHHRWGKKQAARTSARRRIVHEEIGGRTTAWVPALQK